MGKTDWLKSIAKQGGIAVIFTALFTFLIDSQKQNRADFVLVFDRQAIEIQVLNEKVKALQIELKIFINACSPKNL